MYIYVCTEWYIDISYILVQANRSKKVRSLLSANYEIAQNCVINWPDVCELNFNYCILLLVFAAVKVLLQCNVRNCLWEYSILTSLKLVSTRVFLNILNSKWSH